MAINYYGNAYSDEFMNELVRRFQVVDDRITNNRDDIEARLSVIEQRLLIVQRDAQLEKEFPELKAAYDNYNRIASEARTIKALKNE